MGGSSSTVSSYVLDELEGICHAVSPQIVDRDGCFVTVLDSVTASRIAAEAHAVLGVRVTADDLAGAGSVTELGLRVQAAMSRPQAAAAASPSSQFTTDPTALSSAQQRIWFMQQLAPGAVVYNVSTRLELNGMLDVDALRAALTELLARHDILRTRYPVRSGVPHTEILPASAVPLPLVDLSGLPSPAATEAECDWLTRSAASLPFVLEHDLPCRFQLVRCAAARHVLIGTFHHIAVDWLTLNLLVRELGARYAAHVAAEMDAPALTATPPTQYADIVLGKASALDSSRVQRAATARGAALGDVPPLLLPTDLPRPRFPRFAGESAHSLLDAPFASAVADLARQRRVTLFATLLAPLVVLLHRASRQAEFIIGTPVAGRRPEWQGVAGCFINIVALHSRLDEPMSGAELVSRVGAATWEALEAQEVPFDQLVRAMARRGHAALVNVLFSYQASPEAVALPGLADVLLTVTAPPGTAKFDLSLYVIGRGDELRLELEYDVDLYSTQTAAAVLSAYRAELMAIVQNPAAVIDLDGVSGFEGADRQARVRAQQVERVEP